MGSITARHSSVSNNTAEDSENKESISHNFGEIDSYIFSISVITLKKIIISFLQWRDAHRPDSKISEQMSSAKQAENVFDN